MAYQFEFGSTIHDLFGDPEGDFLRLCGLIPSHSGDNGLQFEADVMTALDATPAASSSSNQVLEPPSESNDNEDATASLEAPPPPDKIYLTPDDDAPAEGADVDPHPLINDRILNVGRVDLALDVNPSSISMPPIVGPLPPCPRTHWHNLTDEPTDLTSEHVGPNDGTGELFQRCDILPPWMMESNGVAGQASINRQQEAEVVEPNEGVPQDLNTYPEDTKAGELTRPLVGPGGAGEEDERTEVAPTLSSRAVEPSPVADTVEELSEVQAIPDIGSRAAGKRKAVEVIDPTGEDLDEEAANEKTKTKTSKPRQPTRPAGHRSTKRPRLNLDFNVTEPQQPSDPPPHGWPVSQVPQPLTLQALVTMSYGLYPLPPWEVQRLLRQLAVPFPVAGPSTLATLPPPVSGMLYTAPHPAHDIATIPPPPVSSTLGTAPAPAYPHGRPPKAGPFAPPAPAPTPAQTGGMMFPLYWVNEPPLPGAASGSSSDSEVSPAPSGATATAPQNNNGQAGSSQAAAPAAEVRPLVWRNSWRGP